MANFSKKIKESVSSIMPKLTHSTTKTTTLTTLTPCEIKEGYGSKSAHIEFDENTEANTFLFTVPFEGDMERELEAITFTSSEVPAATLDVFFQLDNKKNLILKKPYDLGVLESDFVELVFTCRSRPTQPGAESYTNTFPLYITVNDVNDKVPEFIGQPYQFSIKEV